MSKKILIAGDDGSVYEIGAEDLERCKLEGDEARQAHDEIKSGGDEKARIHPLVCTAFVKADRVFVDLSRSHDDD